MEKFSKKDIRVFKIGGICAVTILIFWFGTKLHDHWAQARARGRRVEAKLEAINLDKAKQAGLMSIVPKFEMPAVEEEQKFLFREALVKQLAGIKGSKPLEVVRGGKAKVGGYSQLFLKFNGRCKFTQALDLLAKLNENPYLVGIEEFRMKTDPKKPQEVELDLTVSTLVK